MNSRPSRPGVKERIQVGTETVPPHGRLTMGVLWSAAGALDIVRDRLNGLFGSIQEESGTVPFDRYTHYYEWEMGAGISRCFWVFADPFPMGGLQEAKLATNHLERTCSSGGKRWINLDPGLLTLDSLVLATTKPYYHRIYLSKGIYAELALVFKGGRMEPLPWTYPDYRDIWAMEFFLAARRSMKRRIGETTNDNQAQ